MDQSFVNLQKFQTEKNLQEILIEYSKKSEDKNTIENLKKKMNFLSY